MTALTRLHDKGAVTRQRSGRGYAYQWAADTSTLTARRMRTLLDRDEDRESVLSRLCVPKMSSVLRATPHWMTLAALVAAMDAPGIETGVAAVVPGTKARGRGAIPGRVPVLQSRVSLVGRSHGAIDAGRAGGVRLRACTRG